MSKNKSLELNETNELMEEAREHFHRGRYQEALPLVERALALREKHLGPAHPDTAQALNDLGNLCWASGRYERAASLYQRALAIREQALGRDHLDVGKTLNNLGNLYREQGAYERAEPLLERALAIQEESLGREHPEVAWTLGNLAMVSWARGERARALHFLERNADVREQSLGLLLATGSEAQKHDRIATMQEESDILLSFHLRGALDEPEAARVAFETLLRRKGRVLDATAGTIQTLRQQSDPETRVLLDELSRLRSMLATSLLGAPERNPGGYHARNQKLREQIDALEGELSQRSSRYRAATRPITVAEVRAHLPADAVLVDLVLYRPYDPHASGPAANRWGAPRYAAYVLSAQEAPRAVDLGEAAPIHALVRQWRAALQAETRGRASLHCAR